MVIIEVRFGPIRRSEVDEDRPDSSPLHLIPNLRKHRPGSAGKTSIQNGEERSTKSETHPPGRARFGRIPCGTAQAQRSCPTLADPFGAHSKPAASCLPLSPGGGGNSLATAPGLLRPQRPAGHP